MERGGTGIYTGQHIGKCGWRLDTPTVKEAAAIILIIFSLQSAGTMVNMVLVLFVAIVLIYEYNSKTGKSKINDILI